MREIKFRAWSDMENTYFMPGDKYGTKHPLDAVRYFQDGQPVILEQYTGLRDKNGKEIYEGDRIKTKHDIMEVRYWMSAFCLCFKDTESGTPIFPYVVTNLIEVIGNIHEETT